MPGSQWISTETGSRSRSRQDSEHPRAPSACVPVSKYGGLLVANGKVAGISVQVIIDTGAEHSLGNAALHTALLRKGPRHGTGSERTIIGATTATSSGLAVTVPSLEIGDASLRNLSVTFGDLHVFKVWGLNDEPAMLVRDGRDRDVAAFYCGLQTAGDTSAGAQSAGRSATVRKCGPGQCQTRIPPAGT